MIVVPIVNRTNYSKIKPILKQLRGKTDVDIIISSGALIEDFGTIKKDIEEDGLGNIVYMDTCLKSDMHEAMSKNVGLSMIQFSTYLENRKPKLAMVVGDRFDMLAFASCASIQNVPIAHIQGGERSGTIDDKIRFAITALSDYHFPSTMQSARNIIKCGINEKNVFQFGCPAVEYIVGRYGGEPLSLEELRKYSKRDISFDDDEYILAQVHPNTTHPDDVNMEQVMIALDKIGKKAIILYPNIDATNYDIIEVMRKYRDRENFYYFRHFSLDIFVNIMANASCFIGNSSSLIRESASFGVFSINLGMRQSSREKNINVIDCEFDAASIIDVYNRNKDIKFADDNIYYYPDCAKMISNKLLEIIE